MTHSLPQFYTSPESRAADLPFSDAVLVGNIVFLSGQLGILPGTRQLAPGGLAAETHQAMKNILRVLGAYDLGFDAIFKCTVMLADMADWPAFNQIYLSYFTGPHLPTRSAFGARELGLGARVELECWALRCP